LDPASAPTSLSEQSQRFASATQATLAGVLPGNHVIVSRQAETTHRFIVQPENRAKIPLLVAGDHLADLEVSFFLDLDRTGTWLKVVRSDFSVHSVLTRTPLLRLEYRSDMNSAPISHWQVHAERGALSHLLARAHEHNPRLVSKPHDLSSLHLPVGGERFRPCLEDVLQFVVHDCGVDSLAGWEQVVTEGRESWRRLQLRSSIRDLQVDAAAELESLGWTVIPPSSVPEDHAEPFRTW